MTNQQKHPMPAARSHPPYRASRSQGGLSLIVVLLSLVTLAFASVALIRSIDTGSLVMGNLSFKKAATTASDKATDLAIGWVQSNLSKTVLHNDVADEGYSATSLPMLDAAGNSVDATRQKIDWDGKCDSDKYTCIAPKSITPVAGDAFRYQYLITRMCSCAGDPNGVCTGLSINNSCSYPLASKQGLSPKKGEIKYGDNVRFSGTGSPYYRIIVRTNGPRNTATVTETYVHF